MSDSDFECNYRSLECICQALSNKLKAAFHPLYFYLTCCMAVDHQLCTKDSLSDNGPKRLLQPTEPLSGQATNRLLQYVFGPHLPSAAFLIWRCSTAYPVANHRNLQTLQAISHGTSIREFRNLSPALALGRDSLGL